MHGTLLKQKKNYRIFGII